MVCEAQKTVFSCKFSKKCLEIERILIVQGNVDKFIDVGKTDFQVSRA